MDRDEITPMSVSSPEEEAWWLFLECQQCDDFLVFQQLLEIHEVTLKTLPAKRRDAD